MKKFLLYAILFLALAGAADSGYLLIQTVSGKAVICPSVPIGRFNLNQCNIVLATPYAKFLGLPTALYGLIVYLTFVVLILCELNKQNTQNKWGAIKTLSILAGAGVLVSTYFIYLQFFVIEEFCFFFLISA